VAESVVCVDSVIYLILELIEIRLQGIIGFFKNQVIFVDRSLVA